MAGDLPTLGRYQVINKIAAGGMAEVFLAKAVGAMGFQRLVAVKLIHSNFTRDEEFVKMFIDEARIAMHLHHRNIVQVFDLDKVDDTYFIAMEYVHGVNLYDVYERIASHNRWIDPPLALYLVSEVAKGLHFAHTRRGPDGRPLGIIHRDISPQNVLLSFEGEVKITDFGIATAAERLHQTAAGIVKGKYAYMAPERLQELPVDSRVDVFSVGVLLYELLVGENPFACPSAVDTIEKVLSSKIPLPSSRGAPVNATLDDICLKALARDPNQRYASGQAFSDAVTEFAMSMTHHRKDMAQGDAAVSALLAELFPEKVKATPKVANPSELNLPGVSNGGNGALGVPDTSPDGSHPRHAIGGMDDQTEDAGEDLDAPTVMRMVGLVDTDSDEDDDFGAATLPPGSEDRTAPTEIPMKSQRPMVQALIADDDSVANTVPSQSGLETLEEPDPDLQTIAEEMGTAPTPRAHIPSLAPMPPHRADPSNSVSEERLVSPVAGSARPSGSYAFQNSELAAMGATDQSQSHLNGPPQRSKLNLIAGLLLLVATAIVAATVLVARKKPPAWVNVESIPPDAIFTVNNQNPKSTGYKGASIEVEQGTSVVLHFTKEGYKDATFAVSYLEEAPPKIVTGKLEPLRGALRIRPLPKNAEVIIGGVAYVGETLISNLPLPEPIEITIQARGYKTETLSGYRLKPGETVLSKKLDRGASTKTAKAKRRRVLMVGRRGGVYVVSRDGQKLGETPFVAELETGKVELQVRASGGVQSVTKAIPDQFGPAEITVP